VEFYNKLIFCVQINQATTPTKRSVLRATASIYDPLGLLSPVIIQCKILLSQLWQIKVNWDDQLTRVERTLAKTATQTTDRQLHPD
jgi:hypothetical protein